MIYYCTIYLAYFILSLETFAMAGKKQVIRIGYLTGSQIQPTDTYYSKPGQAISGAISFAVNEINANADVLPNHHLEFNIAETFGQEEQSINQTVSLSMSAVSAIIGPQETCQYEARLASIYNIPMVSYVRDHKIKWLVCDKCMVRVWLMHDGGSLRYLYVKFMINVG